MTNTYAWLLKTFPRPIANLMLFLWYLLLLLAIIDRSILPFSDFIYWGI